jgi:hypothetical protein
MCSFFSSFRLYFSSLAIAKIYSSVTFYKYEILPFFLWSLNICWSIPPSQWIVIFPIVKCIKWKVVLSKRQLASSYFWIPSIYQLWPTSMFRADKFLVLLFSQVSVTRGRAGQYWHPTPTPTPSPIPFLPLPHFPLTLTTATRMRIIPLYESVATISYVTWVDGYTLYQANRI